VSYTLDRWLIEKVVSVRQTLAYSGAPEADISAVALEYAKTLFQAVVMDPEMRHHLIDEDGFYGEIARRAAVIRENEASRARAAAKRAEKKRQVLP
jgi:hypothetical protein